MSLFTCRPNILSLFDCSRYRILQVTCYVDRIQSPLFDHGSHPIKNRLEHADFSTTSSLMLLYIFEMFYLIHSSWICVVSIVAKCDVMFCLWGTALDVSDTWYVIALTCVVLLLPWAVCWWKMLTCVQNNCAKRFNEDLYFLCNFLPFQVQRWQRWTVCINICFKKGPKYRKKS